VSFFRNISDIPLDAYQTIYADPPWMETGGGRIRRGADRHYSLMKTKEICELPVAGIAARNCHLYLWVTNNFLDDGFDVCRAWGFRYITLITWAKDRMGLGQYFRGQTEHCIFGVKGMLPYREAEDGKRAQGTTLLYGPRTIHSRKPHQMYEVIERVSHSPRLELFSRNERPGWDAWGSEEPSQKALELEASA
jgi:N6-adenosine-specific RNA methylase IME4